MDSFLRNSYIMVREGEAGPLFIAADGLVKARLDAYAVLPLEQYERLLSLAEARAAVLTVEILAAAMAR